MAVAETGEASGVLLEVGMVEVGMVEEEQADSQEVKTVA